MVFTRYGYAQQSDVLKTDQKPAVGETLILFTDRDVYLPGESIWFGIDYLINNRKTELSLSEVVYVELLNMKSVSLARNKFAIKQSRSIGKISVPEGLESGYYLLRCYTQYQRKGTASGFENVIVTIINPAIPLNKPRPDDSWTLKVSPLTTAEIEQPNTYAIQFNPSLLTELRSAVIVGATRDTLSKVKLASNGLGSFQLTDEKNKRYSVKYELTDSSYYFHKIELNQKEIIEIDKKGAHYYISASDNDNANGGALMLAIYTQTGELIAQKAQATNKKIELAIESGKLYEGFNFVVFSLNELIVASKAIFIPPSKPATINVSVNKAVFGKREQVDLEIHAESVADELGKISVSVVKAGTIPGNQLLPDYIVQNPLMLTSYLKTHFSDKQEMDEQIKLLTAVYNVDLLKSTPDFLMSDESHAIWVPETRGVDLRGIVRDRASKAPQEGVEVLASVLGDNPQLDIYTTNKNGEFVFALDHIQNLTDVYLTVRDERETTLEILLKNEFSGIVPDLSFNRFSLDTSMAAFVEESYINAQVYKELEVDVEQEASEIKAIRFSAPTSSILLSDYVAMPTLTSVFNELMPFVRAKNRGDKYYLEVLDEKTNLTYEYPLLLVDNLPIYNVGEMLKIHPSAVTKIEAIPSTYLYGDHMLKGIVMVYTNTNNFGNIKLPESFTSLEFQAQASPSRAEFPVYTDSETKASRTPDFRNTLFVDNNLELTNNESKISFYTSDHTSKYVVIVKGTDKNGNPVYGETSFTVVD